MYSYLDKKLVSLIEYQVFGNFYARSFLENDTKKVLVIFLPNRISYCQIYPFLFYRKQFESLYNLQFRFVSCEELQKGKEVSCKNADVIIFQTWFTISEKNMVKLITKLKVQNPGAKLHFIDSFAPTDLRLCGVLVNEVETYIKKSLLSDRNLYFRPFKGGTNLTHFYSNLYKLEQDEIDWHVPPEIFDKIRLSPTFFTGPDFLDILTKNRLPKLENRQFALHARLGLGVNGSDWYHAMRRHSAESVEKLQGIKTITGAGVRRKQYLQEMCNSMACFSPFGYGEVCWRDIEAIVAGCVLIKPDMGHLEMAPNIHIPNETYIPVKWDFSDLEEKVRLVIENHGLRERIARKAYSLLHEYARNSVFVKTFANLF